MDKNTSNDEKVLVKCPVCGGSGFRAVGEFCVCITGKNIGTMPDLPEGWADIFGDIFKGKGDGKK